jgi:hypothetical protein
MNIRAVLVASFAGALWMHGCAAGPDIDLGGDAGVDATSDGVPFVPSGDAATCAAQCSTDFHSVLDCNGSTLQTCAPMEACSSGACIPACQAAVANKSAVGCEYYAHDPTTGGNPGCFALYVANTWTTPVNVTSDINGLTIDLSKYTYLPTGTGASLAMTPIGAGGTIPAGAVGIVFLRDGWEANTECGYGVSIAESDPNAWAWTDPPYDVTSTNSAGQALHVVASAPVVMYDIIPFGGGRSEVTGASLMLPTSTWDTNYIAVTPRPPGYNTLNPTIAIVASANNTNVTINPTASIVASTDVAGTDAGVPITYALAKGQVLTLGQAQDLLGSIISSNNPIGLWGQQGCINIDATGGDSSDSCCCDSAHGQIPPVRALGSEYAYARYRNRVDGQDESPPTRITGAVDGTTLTWDPMPTGAPATIGKGQSVQVTSNVPFIVKSQDAMHPFYVASYMTSCSTADPGGADCRGDPEFVGVIPTAQYLSKYVFFTDPTYPETNLVFIRTLGSDKAFHDVTLDCAGTLTGWAPLGSGGQYEFTRIDLSRYDFEGQNGCNNGAHTTQSDAPFTMTVWGWGTAATGSVYTQAVSYAYPAGASVSPINNVVVPPN